MRDLLESRVKEFLLNTVAKKFIAGTTLEEAISVARRLNKRGMRTTLNFLGEHYETRDEVIDAVQENRKILRAIHENELGADVSIKLTQLGLVINEQFCRLNLFTLLEEAQELNVTVEFDMEDFVYNEKTLDMYFEFREQFPNTVLCLQARLLKTEKDIARCAEKGVRVRLCKGAYRESSRVSVTQEKDIKDRYLQLAKLMKEKGVLRSLATHDRDLIMALSQTFQDGDEFQMLLGIEERLQSTLVHKMGHPVRVYVPYGPAWFPFVIRRWRFILTHIKSIL